MAYTANVLVVANVTAAFDDLLDALRVRAERGPIAVTLLMPGGEQAALDAALAAYREAGLEAEGSVADADPLWAVHEVWRPGRFDEIVVSTLPGATSRWLQFDLPHRVAQITDAPVSHVVARPPGYQVHPGGPPPAHGRSALGPLSVLSWGSRR